MKRLFDIFFSTIGLIILLPLFAVVAILVKLESDGSVLFQQQRIGKNFRSFRIYKFRTMTVDAEKKGPQITVGGDKRVTGIGKILRKCKIDEFPQLINILKGEMSFVGPRPEVRKYVELFKSDYEKLLKIRPGITDPSSLKYSKEEDVLSLSKNWEEDYIKMILPEKIKLSSHYVDNHNCFTDLSLIFKTVFKIYEKL
ncbi:MAG: sugar transferase [Deltaproteobacteria bacterium]|nr:sugar transferase [Deltaproteobacteria bacterium]